MEIRKAETCEEITELVKKWFRPGVCTNLFLSAQELQREADRGALYYGVWPRGFLLLRKRDGFFRGAYQFLPGGDCPQLPDELHVILEIPARPKDKTAPAAQSFWQEGGFVPVLERLRYRKEWEKAPAASALPSREMEIVLAKAERMEEALSFLKAHFDPLTGCLPSLEELSKDQVFCLLDEKGAVAGVLHGAFGRASSEIRHLALREDVRRRGYAGALIRAYEAQSPSSKSLVWTGKENSAARRLYEKCGYSPDGWTALVLEYGKE